MIIRKLLHFCIRSVVPVGQLGEIRDEDLFREIAANNF